LLFAIFTSRLPFALCTLRFAVCAFLLTNCQVPRTPFRST
jgi:hypothetical protein